MCLNASLSDRSGSKTLVQTTKLLNWIKSGYTVFCHFLFLSLYLRMEVLKFDQLTEALQFKFIVMLTSKRHSALLLQDLDRYIIRLKFPTGRQDGTVLTGVIIRP